MHVPLLLLLAGIPCVITATVERRQVKSDEVPNPEESAGRNEDINGEVQNPEESIGRIADINGEVQNPDESIGKNEEKNSEVPSPEESAPNPEESVPKSEESVPKPEESAPNPEESVPKPDESAPKPEESAPKPEESAIKNEEINDEVPKTEESAGKDEDKNSEVQNTQKSTGTGEHDHEKRKYGELSNKSYRNTKSGSVKGGGGKLKFKTECEGRPNVPNARTDCNKYSGCRAECFRGYKFTDDKPFVIFTCKNKKWQVEGDNSALFPSCAPECIPPCQNSGICVEPNKCNCSNMFQGPQCQHANRPCYNKPPLPEHSIKKCSTKSCTIECRKGYIFPDNSSIANLVCREGTWVPTKPNLVTLPDCQPICEPPCQNGGNCIAFNVCQCPQELRGLQCQYSMTACSPQKLNFNGRFNCTGDKESLSCVLSCYSGGHFKQPPASAYICEYAKGEFVPDDIPQCVYDSTLQLNPLQTSWLEGYPVYVYSNATTYKIITDVASLHLLKPPQPGACFHWGGSHYKTFDGKVISFESNCSYALVRDFVDNTFSINVEPREDYLAVNVFAYDKEYTLKRSNRGAPILGIGARQLAIPTELPGISAEFTAHYVQLLISMTGVIVKWDAKNFISVEVSEGLWNRTVGMCGRLDGYPENDLETKDGKSSTLLGSFINSWQVDNLGETCPTAPNEIHTCETPEASSLGYAKEAANFCEILLKDPRFTACRTVVDVNSYYDACRWDYCGCKEAQRKECACKSISVFVRECGRQGVTSISNWRDNETCPMDCWGGRVYMSCQPSSQESCTTAENISQREKRCEEGCYCPPGTVLHNQECIQRSQCPCRLRGRTFQPGDSVPKDCNTCTCTEGQWVCTQINCGSRCSSVGDPHYSTFDGFPFDFMGKCSYYLVKGTNYSIETENIPCLGAISEQYNFVSAASPSCTKAVTVRLGTQTIRLKQNREVLVNGVEIQSLPAVVAGAYIHVVSSIFLLVELPNGLVVWWDGATRVYVDAPPTLHGQTQGLCGTFNMNQKDDFLTPEGDIEQSVIAFANKWKTQEKCEDESEKEPSSPCDVNVHNRAAAQKYCSQLHGPLFTACHWSVDYEPYYRNCLFDMCSCQQKVGQCLCPILSAYAKECARKGVYVDWRSTVRECGIHCPWGQVYKVCGDICTHSCDSISRNPNCRPQCVEGCNCPDGETLNNAGECIPISRCPCQYKGLEFLAGYKEVQNSSIGPQLCTCVNADWNCQPATKQDLEKYPPNVQQDKCSATKNEEFTTCEPPEPLTCKNMHNPPEVSAAVCHPGCICKKGYVLDGITKQCIKPVDCPCHHGGRSYTESETIQDECNTCSCRSGKWECTDIVCTGVCTTWGDSHFKTFDGQIYDFHGSCDYVLSKGSIDSDSFVIVIQNAPCSSLGVSCSKSVTLKVTSGGNEESITFTREKHLPPSKDNENIIIREAGLFVFAEATNLGVVVQWDRGTRIYVNADPKWRNKVKGLCGNYNNDRLDDFQTPMGGVAEVSATVFGDSWRLQTYCPESVEITDACSTHPTRKLWAMKKCGVLKTSLFKPCHSEVPIDTYMERCIFDTCACDMGGDCECLCTAIAAYAQECSMHGVHIKWRSQELCPVQCDERCSNYQPCVTTCPIETCDNHLYMKRLTQLCKEETCVEGCEMKPCPPGQVYFNHTALECVPVGTCRPICLEIENKIYYEGDLVSVDDCHSCFCSRNTLSCIGKPCTTPRPPSSEPFITTPSTIPPNDNDLIDCQPGWTEWINENPLPPEKNRSLQKEPLPTKIVLRKQPIISPVCDTNQMVSIECRVVGSHESAKETGLDAECSLERGLVCYECPDFEIRVLCNCGTTVAPTVVPTVVPIYLPCDVAHPHSPHPVDCYSFYHCVSTPEGPELIEKTCGPFNMYNRDTQVCDHIYVVTAKWPHCATGISPTILPSTPTPSSTLSAGVTTTTVPSTSTLGSTLPTGVSTTTLSSTSTPGSTLPAGIFTTTLSSTSTLGSTLSAGVSTTTLSSASTPGSTLSAGVSTTSSPSTSTLGSTLSAGVSTTTLLSASTPGSTLSAGLSTTTLSSASTPGSTLSAGISTTTLSSTSIPGSTLPAGVFTTTLSPTSTLGSTLSACPPGETWQSCSIPCSQVCHYYGFSLKKIGLCQKPNECVPGCVPNEFPGCPLGSFWRDDESCVQEADCTCYSNTGKLIRPGKPHHESDCEVCQCLNNRYTCTICNASTTEGVTPPVELPETTTMYTIWTTESPPPKCDPSRYVSLIQGDSPLPNSAFSASGETSQPGHQAHTARIPSGRTPIEGGSWIPDRQGKDEYLQIDLGDRVHVYGVIVQGDPDGAGHVTSYRVLHSDGHSYRYIMNAENSTMRFRGPLDGESRVIQIFPKPVDAQYIRFNPLTWKNNIAMRVELIGCGETPGTSSVTIAGVTPTPQFPVCEDEMGFNKGMMRDEQVRVSTVRNGDQTKYGIKQAVLSAEKDEDSRTGGAWIPVTNDIGQWIQFDFLGPRNLTGIITRGQDKGTSWTEAFNVQYSHDGVVWNPVLDSDGKIKEFMANFDNNTPQKNLFDRPLHAQYLRILPTKWHNDIALRVEVLGCYEHYPITTTETPLSTPPTELPEGCLLCSGVPFDLIDTNACSCSEPLLWDGRKCVNSTMCPCYVKNTRYDVGTVFLTEDCENCVCKLSGVPECKKKECDPCEKGLQTVLSSLCTCSCKPCPEGTILCPTTSICINETSWCDGVEDCPDDEWGCPSPSPTIATTVRPLPNITTPPPPCLKPKCEPGFILQRISPGPVSEKVTRKQTKGVKGGKVYRYRNTATKTMRQKIQPSECDQWTCVRIIEGKPPTCGKPNCPPNYQLMSVHAKGAICPRYTCVPANAICNVTGRTFNTFDGIEYKYDICDHILAEDYEENKWDISLVSICSGPGPCSRHLVIVQDEHHLTLYSNMSSEFDDVTYTVDETKQIGGKNKAFLLSRIGDSMYFNSNRYGFWVKWDSQSNVKIRVPGKLSGKVNGLCGFYNGHSDDDKTMSNGVVAKSTKDFVNSWSNVEPVKCLVHHCPEDLQKNAFEICSAIRSDPLSKCESVVNTEAFKSRCVETVCECLAGNSSDEACRCQALLNFVTQCQEADNRIDLTGWRTHNNCPADCKTPLVHYDCYRHECVPSCDQLRDTEQCQTETEACFSGCFCPDGLLQKGEKCVKPAECRDCVCDGFGDPQYLTFDRLNYTFNGNCTYVASQDVSPTGEHIYQVLVTNRQCKEEPTSTCTEAVSVKYQGHTVSMKHSDKELKVHVDGIPVTDVSHTQTWLQLDVMPGNKVTALIIPLQLEVSYFFHNYQFTVKLSSISLGGKTEGLCGNCNGNKTDDFLLPNGTIATSPEEFGLKWLVPSSLKEENCQPVKPEKPCDPLPRDEDPCLRLMDDDVFQKCRNILDPASYIAACQLDLCHSLDRENSTCRDVEAYVRDCQRAGVCLDWRSALKCPFLCPNGLEYQACQQSCIKTCNNLKEDSLSCDSPSIDGCYCPGNKVLRDGECVDVTRCEPCDDDNHYDGDVWQQDQCTNCTCNGRNKECHQLDCSAKTVCDDGMTAIEIPASDTECCNKITCVPLPTPSPDQPVPPCEEPKIPDCQPDQQLVSVRRHDGCIQVVCECAPCKPLREQGTPSLEVGAIDRPEPGIVEELDESGCCPIYVKKCVPQNCPVPDECPPPFKPLEIPNDKKKCCPSYRCGVPPDECIINSKDGSEKTTVKVGSKWKDTPCSACSCISSINGGTEVHCNTTVCPSADIAENLTSEYVVNTTIPPNACCPYLRIEACRVGTKILQPGQSWVDKKRDRCETHTCKMIEDSVKKEVSHQECGTICDPGFEYFSPEPDSDDCCGQCKPIGCVFNGEVYPEGIIPNPIDNCTQYSCISINNTFYIHQQSPSCPVIPVDIQQDYMVELREVPGKCCKEPHFLACIHEGEIYQPGETWQSASDPCKNISCDQGSHGTLSKSEATEGCSVTCSQGWQYFPPPSESHLCCGLCKQVACVFQGQLYDVGYSWKSPDGCTEFTCSKTASDEFQVISMAEPCPLLNNCDPKDVYIDGCCKKCNITTENNLNCQPKPKELHPEVIKEDDPDHGLCINLQPVKDFAVCEGTCLSFTHYNAKTNKHDSNCRCCQPSTYGRTNVTMTCNDNYIYQKRVPVPIVCSCRPCGETTI